MRRPVWSKYLRQIFGSRSNESRGLRRAPRLSAEALEDRSVPATLTLTIPTVAVSEAAGPNSVGALLNRTGDLSQALTVNLTSSDPTEATVPPTVTFQVGQQEVGFSISAVDDAVVDGTQTVTITATATVTQGQPFGLDLSYGTNGLAPTRLDMSVQPPVQAIAVQPDGKAIVASENPASDGWHVQRFHPNGTLDTSFGGGLVNTIGLGGSFPVPHKIVVLPDGDILVGGKVSAAGGAAPVLVRYNQDGTLDTAFGGDGRADIAGAMQNLWVTDVDVRPDGRILLGLGQNGTVLSVVAQLNPNGTFDTTFGNNNGLTALNLGGWAEEVEVLADGTFLVGGSFNGPVFVAKVQPNGVGRVASFGTNGIATLSFGRDGSAVAGMEVDAQGRIVVGADVFNFVNGNSTPGDFAAGRLLPNGTPDASFAGDGTAVVDAGGSELANGLVVQQDGKVILGGFLRFLTADITDSAMVRFTEAGAPDPTFDGDGIFRQSIVTTYTPDAITDLVLQDDGKLLALTGWGDDFRVARFHLGAQTFPLSAADALDVLDNDAVNQPPTAQNQSVSTAEDTPKTGTVVATDPDGAALTYVVVAGPANGTLTLNPATGAFTYTPNANYFGSDSFTFKASDGLADSNVATVSITVAAVNDAPVAQDRAFTTAEDPVPPGLAGTLAATDVDGAALTYSVVAQPANGTVTITNAATGAFTYRPRFNFSGTDTFTYKARDGSADSNTATVTITVTPVNDAPFPSPVIRELTTPEDTPVSGQLAATDPEGDPVTFTLEAGPSNGTLSLAANGAFTFTPAADFSGVAEFVYRAADPSGASNLGGVRITVTPVNDAPVGAADAYTVAEDGVLTVSAGPVTRLRMVSEPGDFVGQGLTYDFVPGTAAFSIGTNFDNGVSLDVDPPALGEFWTLEFAAPNDALLTPGTYLDAQRFPFQAAGRPGLDVSGNGRGANTLTGRFTVYDVVRGPGNTVVSFAAAFEQHNEGEPPALVGWVVFNSTFGAGGGVLANDTDVEGDLLPAATLVGGPSHGTLAFKGDGTFSYTPDPNFHGTDTFTYRANDGRADGGVTTVTITVTPVNDPPVASLFQYVTNEDTPLNDTLRASDADGDPLTYSVVSQPAQGTVQVTNAATGAFTYTPPPDFHGTVSFTFKVNDGTADSNVAIVFVTVRPVNDAPVAAGQSVTTTEDTPIGGTVTATDVDNPTLTFAVVANPANGTLTLNPASGAFTYTPNANFAGSDTFTFRASDGEANSNTATVSIAVTPVNDTPVAQGQAVSTDEDAAVGGQLTATDVDSPALTFAVVGGPASVHVHPERQLPRVRQLHVQGERRHGGLERGDRVDHGPLGERRPGRRGAVGHHGRGHVGRRDGHRDRHRRHRPHLRRGDRPGARHADPQPGDRRVHLHPERQLQRHR
ncbi:tandem-95 repeat protein [bacterium]|nr:tandem-95 repeat protein [bacterium]